MTLQRVLERLIWLCMMPPIVMDGVLLLLHLHTLNERRQMLVDSVVRAAASSLDQMLEVRLGSLQLLGRMLEEPAMFREGRLNLLRAHGFCTEYWQLHGHHVLIGSATGEMLVNTRVPLGQALPPLPDVHHRSAVMLALTGQTPAIGDPFIGPIAGVPWTVALVAPPVSPLDHGGVRALLLVGTLLATISLAYWGARAAVMRLTRAMSTLIHPHEGQQPAADIQEVAQVKAELMRLERERLAAQETERRRIGLELHDDLQQKLALIRQDLALEPQHASRDRQLAWVDESIASTRRLVLDLRPPVLQEVGLAAALMALASQHQATHGQQVDVSTDDSENWAALPEDATVALFRVAQEALNNARKHARAEAVHISLSGLP